MSAPWLVAHPTRTGCPTSRETRSASTPPAFRGCSPTTANAAAVPGDGVVLTQPAGQPLGDRAQQPVPVLDGQRSEPTKIGEHERDDGPPRPASAQRLVEPVEQEHAVGEPG
nr:hypothetical protein [Actinophytocola sp.]